MFRTASSRAALEAHGFANPYRASEKSARIPLWIVRRGEQDVRVEAQAHL
jgi:hypothetical protein